MNKPRKPRPLVLFNGRWQGGAHGAGRAYVAAYSRADAGRVIAEVLGHPLRGVDGELRDYWAKAWGRPMDGITPERGMWVQRPGDPKPVRMYPKKP